MYCPNGISPVGNSGCFSRESQLQQSCATQPTLHAGCFSVSIIHQTQDMDYRIFNVHTDVHACNCTQGCTDTVREPALKVDSGRKIPCHTRKPNLPEWRAGPTLYQLSYIPIPNGMQQRRWNGAQEMLLSLLRSVFCQKFHSVIMYLLLLFTTGV